MSREEKLVLARKLKMLKENDINAYNRVVMLIKNKDK